MKMLGTLDDTLRAVESLAGDVVPIIEYIEINNKRSITMNESQSFFMPVQVADPAGSSDMVWAITERETNEIWCHVGTSLQMTMTIWRAMEVDRFSRGLG